MKTINNKPLYKVILGDSKGLTAISLVDEPAMEVDFLKFKKENINFSLQDDKQIITGIAILADTPIYRNSPTMGEYYVIFEKDTIKELVQKFLKDDLIVNLQHDNNLTLNSINILESYFINHERNISPKEFELCSDGSWVITFKILDKDLWKKIKEDITINGFSIEINSYIDEIETQDEVDDFINKILTHK